MTDEQSRRRAPAMSPEQRRTAILQATLPLVREQGANVTTRQIAQAAGIAEGTIFRVFTDKNELLGACLIEAFRTDQVCAAIRQVSRAGELTDRLVEAALLFQAHFADVGELAQTMVTTGYDPRPHHHGKARGPFEARTAFIRDLTEAVASLLEAEPLRLPPLDVARMLLSLVLGARFTTPDSASSRTTANTTEIRNRIGVLLHGALAEPATDPTTGKS